jgi:hypothetical protein
MPYPLRPLHLLTIISSFFLFLSCHQEEDDDNFPVVKSEELKFEDKIQGIWLGQDYFIEYYDEEGKKLFTDPEPVFIATVKLDGEKITYDYRSASPDWTNAYTTRTEGDKNFIVFPGFPEVQVAELTRTLMIWEETTYGGSFDNPFGEGMVQAAYQIRTFKFSR